jgi:two-component system, NarL family, sensor kinase
VAASAIARDITERIEAQETLRRTQADLKQSQQELREISARLMTNTEEEGKRIARELHDSFGPRLAWLNLEVSALERLLSSQLELAERLRRISSAIGEVAQATHDLARQLHPAVLSQLGLATALEAECASFSKQYGIEVDFAAERPQRPLPDAASLCLYRVAQESLQNIRKHAHAKRASITLTWRGDEIVMAVQDFGRGFDLDAVRGKGGLGLVSMEERVRLVHGSLSVTSKPGAGTRLEARIPIRGN